MKNRPSLFTEKNAQKVLENLPQKDEYKWFRWALWAYISQQITRKTFQEAIPVTKFITIQMENWNSDLRKILTRSETEKKSIIKDIEKDLFEFIKKNKEWLKKMRIKLKAYGMSESPKAMNIQQLQKELKDKFDIWQEIISYILARLCYENNFFISFRLDSKWYLVLLLTDTSKDQNFPYVITKRILETAEMLNNIAQFDNKIYEALIYNEIDDSGSWYDYA